MSEHNIKIRHEEGYVVFSLDGKGYKIPWQVADRISRVFAQKARLAEEAYKANQIIMDNALMQRSGFPVGLSNHPKIKDETIKEALHNRNLRRALPRHKNSAGVEGIKSRGAVGSPTLRKTS